MNRQNKTNNYLISIIGPTGIGKTATAIGLAKAFSTEIISADSRQFYKEMKIGTAVPSKEELAAIKHHFIQHKSVFENYSVGDFEREAIQKLEFLFKTHKHLFLVGGSGLYLDAVNKGLDTFPKIDPSIRENLNGIFQKKGIAPLQEELKKRDPEYSVKVDLQNPHRVIRALEICIGSGKAYSTFLSDQTEKRNFKSLKIGLEAPRKLVYERTEQRVNQMMEKGLLEEAKSLLPHKKLNALNTVGYKELFAHLEGNCSLQEAVAEIKKNTRRFAKRQLTWFRKDPGIKWFAFDVAFDEIIKHIDEKTRTRS